MNNVALALAVAIACCGGLAADHDGTTEREVLAIERQGMDGWLRGDPDPTLEILDPEITYIHSVANERLDGLAAVKTLFEGYRGTPLFESYEIANPKVQANGDSAVLTYVLVRHNGPTTTRWNATQVYLRKQEGWRIVHSHWSENKPSQP